MGQVLHGSATTSVAKWKKRTRSNLNPGQNRLLHGQLSYANGAIAFRQ
jgi:hypothetical protein